MVQQDEESRMLDVLKKAERALPKLLDRRNIWKSVYVDYHPPYVERLWTDFGEYRIYLHRIQSCEPAQALFHPHPWPSVMRILNGEYEMGVGYSDTEEVPDIAAKINLVPGVSYEMTNPNGWHYVRPLTSNTLSVMVTGKPWGREGPKPDKVLESLSDETVLELLHIFSGYYK